MDTERQAEAIRKVLATSSYGTFKLFRGEGTGIDETIEQHMKNHEIFGLRSREFGLGINLFNKLRVFSENRINAIHGFIVGRTDYENLKDVVFE